MRRSEREERRGEERRGEGGGEERGEERRGQGRRRRHVSEAAYGPMCKIHIRHRSNAVEFIAAPADGWTRRTVKWSSGGCQTSDLSSCTRIDAMNSPMPNSIVPVLWP